MNVSKCFEIHRRKVNKEVELFAHTVQFSILGELFDVNPSFVSTTKTDSPEATARVRGKRVPWSQNWGH